MRPWWLRWWLLPYSVATFSRLFTCHPTEEAANVSGMELALLEEEDTVDALVLAGAAEVSIDDPLVPLDDADDDDGGPEPVPHHEPGLNKLVRVFKHVGVQYIQHTLAGETVPLEPATFSVAVAHSRFVVLRF